MEKGKGKIILQIFQCGARAGETQVTLSSHSRLSSAAHLGTGGKKSNEMQRSKTRAHMRAAPSIYLYQAVPSTQTTPGDILGWSRGSERNNEGYTCVSEGQPAGGWLGRAVGVLLLQVVTVGAILT